MRAAFLTGLLVLGAALTCGGLRAEDTAGISSVKSEVKHPRIEVVFALDTTGSMGGLIQAAKEKIWSIANTLTTTKPSPMIRLGLVGYRDRGDEYVTKLATLTDDLDAVYKQLMEFQAAGGGDAPESVNQALNEAVTKFDWSADKDVYRTIFLVGDAPPHMDYPDDVKYPESCKLAASKGIVINAIECGNAADTETVWRDIAQKADGQFFKVDQAGSAILASTPFDADLARLSHELDATRIYYGTTEEVKRAETREKTADAIYAGSSVSSQAQRIEFNWKESGSLNFVGNGNHDLVTDAADGSARPAEIKTEQLPEKLRSLSPEEREKLVQTTVEQRKNIQSQISELSKKRQTVLNEEARKQAAAGKEDINGKIYNAIKDQAKAKGLEYSAPSAAR